MVSPTSLLILCKICSLNINYLLKWHLSETFHELEYPRYEALIESQSDETQQSFLHSLYRMQKTLPRGQRFFQILSVFFPKMVLPMIFNS